MLTLSSKQQWGIGGVLMLVMLATRSHMVDHLQDASWAVFLLLGFYVRPLWAYALFWVAGFAVDYAVTSNGWISSYCLTPAYGFTFVAYAALWAAGRWLASQYQQDWRDLVKLAAATISGTLVCFLITNASFYALAGYFGPMSAADYSVAVLKYLPAYLQTTLFYVGVAALVHIAALQTTRTKNSATV